MKILAVIFLSLQLASSNVNAFWGSKKITVVCYFDEEPVFKYTYEVKGEDVIQSTIVPANQTPSKRDELYKMEKLEDCTVSDADNWMCGGKNFADRGGWGTTAAHKMHKGKYSHTPFKSNIAVPEICQKRIQLN